MLVPTKDGGIVDREEPERKRAPGLSREALLRAAFDQIAISSPEQLRRLVDRCNLFLQIAKGRRDKALERYTLEVGLRAARRLRHLKRAV